MTQYTAVRDGVEVNLSDGILAVRVTSKRDGMLVQGGHLDAIYSMPYAGTMEDAIRATQYGITDIDRCLDNPANLRRAGSPIQ